MSSAAAAADGRKKRPTAAMTRRAFQGVRLEESRFI
jgi:hypothetical protein